MRIFDRSDNYPLLQIAGSTITIPVERKFASVDNVQIYCDAFLALRWVRETWPRAQVPVVVRRRSGQQAAHYERAAATIAVPGHVNASAWAMRELVVLHELAHHLAPAGEQTHGPEFVGRLVHIVGEIIGPEAQLMLRVTMSDMGARVG
ncbi:TIGR04338 family metallohydrolase [Nakamurella antarctica]|uniref:TIGR04338 family metallohydrolase n=2 Tax=Nakamurella antarctica TaxID=1902245 RepID=A0A3G8ZHX5_9ACTN|nr:TIGR04338 family metallohydrolase [Nakamurella antarctica]